MKKYFFLISIIFLFFSCKSRPSVEVDYSKGWSYSEVISLERLFETHLEDWPTLNLPNFFQSRKNPFGFILLKKKLSSYTIENILEQESQTFSLGRASDVVFIYLNDKLIFQSGSHSPYQSSFDRYIFTELKSADINAEGDNIISVVLYNEQGRPSYIRGPNIQIGNSVSVLENFYYVKMLAFALPLITLLFAGISIAYWYAHRRENITLLYFLFSLCAIAFGAVQYLRWYEIDLSWLWPLSFLDKFLFTLLYALLVWDFLTMVNLARRKIFFIPIAVLVLLAFVPLTFVFWLGDIVMLIAHVLMALLMIIFFRYFQKTKTKLSLYKKIAFGAWFVLSVVAAIFQTIEIEFFVMVVAFLFMLSYAFDKIQNSGDLFSFLDDENVVEEIIQQENQIEYQQEQKKLLEKATQFLTKYKLLDVEAAQESLEKELQAWHILLKECLQQNAHALCLDVAQYLIDLDGQNIAANFAKAYCLKKTAQHHEALQIALKVYSLQASHRQNLTLIIQLYLLLGDKQNALRYCQEALQNFPHDARLLKFREAISP